MSQALKSLRGFNDVLPQETHLWNKTLTQLTQILNQYCIDEIRIPLLESTALFARGVGEATDIVEKEMFSFVSRDEENICLRPEGTAGTIRACIQHGLTYNQEQRLYYFGPIFRYERPQKGRYRQFHQLGVEILGIKNPYLDAEIIIMTQKFWETLGIAEHMTLELNTIGTSQARANFGAALVEYLTPFKEELDADSQRRLTSNPLRILDSKDHRTQEILLAAPQLGDFLDEESKTYFNELCHILNENGIQFVINDKLVRGLDYYNDTVFEWTTDKLGAQATVCGGGRYDRLVELLGGKHPTPGFGFGLGWERLMILLETVHGEQPAPNVDVFIIPEGTDQQVLATSITCADKLRQAFPELRILNNTVAGKLKKQFAKADKAGAKAAVLINSSNLENNQVVIKNLANGEQVETSLEFLVAAYTKLVG